MAQQTVRADFAATPAPAFIRLFANWVVASADNHGMSFLVLDKVSAQVFAFDRLGKILGATPALLGAAQGDDSVPGVGNKPLSAIKMSERTTPAGRFVSSLGRDLGVKNILWVDYPNAISLHRVVKGTKKDRRLERLATPTAQDNRISFGCINVPVNFFDSVVETAFTGASGVVYILPEKRKLVEVFPTYRDIAS